MRPRLDNSRLPAPFWRRADRGTITGTISDPAGAVVAGAAIEARNVATGAVYPVASSSTGNYTIAQLPAGNYELAVTVTGFKKFVRQNLLVEVAETVRVDALLEVGASSESVTITEAAPLLKTEGGEVSHNINTSELTSLPILTLSGAAAIGSANTLGNIRNPLSMIQLLPGARQSSDTDSSGILRVNGMPSNSQQINIEGQHASNGFNKGSNQIIQAGVESIQEVAVQTSNYSAEYGQAGGGYFNYTMKSGTNQLHGSAYDYFVNEALSAGLPFTDRGLTNSLEAGQHIRNPLRQNDYGFTFGGPITIPKLYRGHDRTFFFFSFEQFRQSVYSRTTVGVVPTAAQRQGNFSAALSPTCNVVPASGANVCLNEVFDPLTNTTVNGVQERTPFPGNIIPLSRIDPTTAIIQNMIPLPNTAGLFNYTAPAYLNFRHSTIPSIKIDHSITSKVKLSAYYSLNHQFSPQNNGFPEPYTALQAQHSTANTVRLNLDTTLTPTLLLHVGAGYLELSNPSGAPQYNQKQLFPDGVPFTAGNYFPYMAGMFSTNGGGWTGGGGYPVTNTGVAFTLSPELHDYKPTFNASVTWVKGNHTYKLGATALFEGTQGLNASRAQGEFTFAQQQTADPSQNGQPFANVASSGFGYASFFLGLPSSIATAAIADERLGDHTYGIYGQDDWKVTRKLTFNYGIRWDYGIAWKEQYGRQQSAAFNLPNPLIGGRIGTVEYEATCKCSFTQAYPFSFGPHLGVAYQITPKTVFRAGGAISYAAETEGGVVGSSGDFYSIPSAAYGLAAGAPGEQLADGDPEGPGNRFGNPVVHWPDFTPHYPVPAAPGIIPPSSPFISIARNTGRLPRTFQWSVGFQRELTRNLVVDAAYVGNRGAWWEGPLLASLNYNALTPQQLLPYGLNVQNAADTTLLNTQINSPNVIQRFPYLANPASVYPGFPNTQTLLQTLRPYPQWNGIPPFLGPPDGNTWYDSLQIKGTQRLQHGLSMQVAYTWEKELTNGTNSDFSYVVPSPPLINDVFNKAIDKQISSYSLPQLLIISFNYQTPNVHGHSSGMKVLSWVTRDWTMAGILRYQSGQILQSPPSANNLLSNLARGPSNNPAVWGGGYTFLNRVPGQPLFLVNPNSHFDPTTQLVLNPNAWVEPPYGTFGGSAPYLNDFRWRRQPAESASFGRVFPIGNEGRYRLQIRAEFQNIFNRLFYSAPVDGFITAPTLHGNPGGSLSGGYGFVNFLNGAGAQPRGGQIVARFQF
ncbi:MAG TPA: TonB-dependent receptor [Bryobacteraceae bacterium]